METWGKKIVIVYSLAKGGHKGENGREGGIQVNMSDQKKVQKKKSPLRTNAKGGVLGYIGGTIGDPGWTEKVFFDHGHRMDQVKGTGGGPERTRGEAR